MSPNARKRLAAVLTALGTFLAVLAIFGIWAQRQVLETDKWVDTTEQLLESEHVRSSLATYLVDELYANVDVQAEIESQLPPRLQPLAGPVAGQLRDVANKAALRVLSSP